MPLTYLPLAKSPMTALDEVKVRMGMRAKGSWMFIRTFIRSFMLDRSPRPEKMVRKKVGMMAIVRVSSTLCHIFQVKFRKPWRSQVRGG